MKNLVYIRGILVWPVIMIVSWVFGGNNLVYFFRTILVWFVIVISFLGYMVIT